MYDVFISYARSDKPRAAQFQHAIKRCGWTVWWDADLLPGQQWNDEIERELRAAGAVVVLWSKDSVKSQFVCDEATLARELNKLVPVTLDGTRPKVGMGQLQLENMSEWNGIDSEHPGLIRVLQGIRHITKTGHVPEPLRQEARLGTTPQGGPHASFSKATIAGIAIAAALALGTAGIWYFRVDATSPGAGDGKAASSSSSSTAPAGGKEAPGAPPVGKNTEPAKDVKNGGGRSPGSGITPVSRTTGKPKGTEPIVVPPPPAATSMAGGTTAAPTTERGCATLIAATRKRPDVAEGFFDLGKCHFAEGRFNDSVIAYNSAIEINENVSRYFEARGQAKWKNDMPAQGLSDLKSAIDLKPADASLYETRGQIFFAMRRYQEAQDDYSQATRLNAKSKRAWLGLADAAEKTGSDEIATAAKAQASALP